MTDLYIWLEIGYTLPEWQFNYTTTALKLAEIYSTEHRLNTPHFIQIYIKLSNWASEYLQ